MSIKKVYLIRHGQTDYNLQSIMQGSGVDTSLNAKGQHQSALFFEKYKEVPFDKVYTSTLQRSIESVQGFIDLGIPHDKHPGLNEISWGVREGKRITTDVDEYYRDMLQTWNNGGTDICIEGGESPQLVYERQKPFVELMLSRPEEKNVLICMHGRAMRILLCHILRYPLHCMDLFPHENLCLYQLDYTGSMFVVKKFCDVDHLKQVQEGERAAQQIRTN
ncbi:putative phosphoglycerate mutase [Pontibacter ummariensis]|uniref:Probable phosphoglycerate mutase n=1 Tax=Pontibacter ummariensis TaxID=1610492 RepID=A0A239C2C7_9BACT|nr:histidine phosphatase family protein [Pontibacter ummariensis]PRY15520.1 putative phosphoglycerate mutase [Pontibacter ummariensis]SNS13533.1 probable phosphoglycerate mutase [Pontibacter ummariensis]